MRVEYSKFWGQTGLLSLIMSLATNVYISGRADRLEISTSFLKIKLSYFYLYKIVFNTLVSYQITVTILTVTIECWTVSTVT